MNGEAEARRMFEMGIARVKTTKYPKEQKFPPGTRVVIAKDLGLGMRHFPSGLPATVEYTYKHAYGGGKDEAKSYSLNVDGHGSIAWYYEHQLSMLKEK